MKTRLLALLLAAMPVALAQAPTGQINGTVSDPTGAVVPGAIVILTNSATNIKREIITNESGIFSLPALPPGTYSLSVEAKGFPRQVRERVDLQVGQTDQINFTLQVGNVAETIQVVGGAPVLQSETAELGTVIENRRIVELPLNGRNYLQLVSLAPGATTNGPASSQGQQRMGGSRNTFALNVAGQRAHYNHYTLDGIENTDPNFNTYLLLPSIDALQEFKVESGIFSAEYGRAIAQINVTTKSGTNALHASFYEFMRNAAFDAKNFFDPAGKPIPPFQAQPVRHHGKRTGDQEPALLAVLVGGVTRATMERRQVSGAWTHFPPRRHPGSWLFAQPRTSPNRQIKLALQAKSLNLQTESRHQ